MRDARPPSLESFPRVITTAKCSKQNWVTVQPSAVVPCPRPGSVFGKAERVAIRILEPSHSGASRCGPDASFILLHTRQERPENAKEVLKFFDWAFKSGDQMAADLDYVAIPDAVVKMIQSDWKAKIKDAAGKALY